MTMWIMIFWGAAAIFGFSFFYLGTRVHHFFSPQTIASLGQMKEFLLSTLPVIGFIGLVTLCIDFINAAICVIYFAMIWALTDFAFYLLEKFFHLSFAHYYAGWVAIVLSVAALGFGWYTVHHVEKTTYEITTTKNMSDLKVVMFADSHMGTTFNADGFQKHLETMQQENPDIVLVVGDYVDDDSTKDDMIKATKFLGQMKTKYGIYFVMGNHDKGYYGVKRRGYGEEDLVNELEKNGIVVLRDQAVLVNNSFYVIGRKDYSVSREQGRKRLSMDELTKDLDKSKYLIVLDHQPADYKNQAKSEVDLVLSGHAHGGQLFPFNQVGKWIGANDLVYGYEKRNNTNFIVSSGISDWAIKFKTGTKAEFVVIDIKKDNLSKE